MSNALIEGLSRRIEVIESAYEFMLAFAAQGHEANHVSNHSQDVATHLAAMDEALSGLGSLVDEVAENFDADNKQQYQAFIDAVKTDADKARGAVCLVSTRTGISSQLIDNLNASIHLRALLTDLFLIDEAFSTINQN